MTWSQLAVIPVLSVLLLVHELGHFLAARRAGIIVEEFGIGLPPRIFGVKRGGVIYSLNFIPLGAFVKMAGENGEVSEGTFASKSKLARAGVLVAGPGMNFLFAGLLFAVAFMVGWPPPTSMDIFVQRVMPGSPAEAAGLQPGDKLVALDGQRLETASQFVSATRERLGQQVTLTIERDGAQTTRQIVPRTEWPDGEGPLGIGLQGTVIEMQPVSYPPHEALARGMLRAGEMVVFTLSVPVMIAEGIIDPELARPIGPVGIAQITTDAADQIADGGWWFPLISITAAISVGLAVANMLPLPALDGGRLLLIGVEAIRGRRIAPEREGALHFVGLIVLLTLMVVIAYYDIVTPIPEIDWGPR
jgi:regulator of sigma E protease